MPTKTKFVRIEVCEKCEGVTQRIVSKYDDYDYECLTLCNLAHVLLAVRCGNVGYHRVNTCVDCVDSSCVQQRSEE